MVLVLCKTCDAVIVASGNICPQCGASQTNVFSNLVKFFLLLIFFIAAFVWLSGEVDQWREGDPTPAMTDEQ